MKKLLISKYLQLAVLFCVWLLTNPAFSQIGAIIGPNPSSEKVYYPKRTVSEKPNNDAAIRNLAVLITKNETSEEGKAKAIYVWMAKNIEYDHELRGSKTLQKKIYTSEENIIANVLKRKKALCGGYAFLYQSLCEQIGIQSEVINGFGKSYSPNVTRAKTPNHTWNAVKINGQWSLLDITLARSHASNGNPDIYWFKTDPKYFIKTHFPENIKWALLKNPINRYEFEAVPL